MAKNSFGQKIKQVRKEMKLTQAKLAELAGINEKHVSKIETGVYFPTYKTLSKILKILNLKMDDVGIVSENFQFSNSEFYLKSLQILNSAKSEKEIKYYYCSLKQAKLGFEIIQSD